MVLLYRELSCRYTTVIRYDVTVSERRTRVKAKLNQKNKETTLESFDGERKLETGE